MERRHQDQLLNRLESGCFNGCAHITWEELYNWYKIQKIAAKTYRDLEERWQEISEGNKGVLMMVEGSGGIYIFAEESIKKVDSKG